MNELNKINFKNEVQHDIYNILATFEASTHIVFLHVLDPLDGLSLRVDHEGPAVASCDDDSILRGEGV